MLLIFCLEMLILHTILYGIPKCSDYLKEKHLRDFIEARTFFNGIKLFRLQYHKHFLKDEWCLLIQRKQATIFVVNNKIQAFKEN